MSVWDHDLWQEIYDISDPKTRNACADIYRLILDMHNSDVLASKIADKVNHDRKVMFSRKQKITGAVFAFLVGASQIYQAIPHK